MEVVPVAVSGGGAVQLPFQRRNVQEWSRLDRLTGMLEHARVETDQWAANTATSSRKYGKVVDSRARNLADGSVQQRQRKQLEVFQAQVPGGSFQVIRTQRVTSTSSSSSNINWRGTSASPAHNFDNLQLSGHPLDLAPQKNKASIGRSGSIRTRRPPSRPRSIISKLDSSISEDEKLSNGLDSENTQNIDSRLSQVSRICHQIHEAVKKQAFDNSPTPFDASKRSFNEDLEIEVANARLHHFQDSSTDEEDGTSVQIQEITDDHLSAVSKENKPETKSIALSGSIHKIISRKKSSSTEDLQNACLETCEKNRKTGVKDLDWKRTSHIRRSLQFPLKVTQESSNISQQKTVPVKLQELDDSRVRDVSTLKGYEALESVFRRGANIAESVNKSMTRDRDDSEDSTLDSLASHLRNENMSRQLSNSFGIEGFSRRATNNAGTPPSKRHSFVTVESLKEVKGRLRHLNASPLNDTTTTGTVKDIDDHDDGIVTEDISKHTGSNESMELSVPSSRVRSYVFGMEAHGNNDDKICNSARKPFPGTGSLESRISNKSTGSGISRSEEWYNRRKSYGFEPVHSHDSDDHSKSIKFREKNKVESSTDSGICRSSEAVTTSLWNRTPSTKTEEIEYPQTQIISDHSPNSENVLKVSHSIQIKKAHGDNFEGRQKMLDVNDEKNDDCNNQKGRRTVVTLGKELNSHNSRYKLSDDNTIVVHNSIVKDDLVDSKPYTGLSDCDSKLRQIINSPPSHRERNSRSVSEPITITIPVVSEDQREINNVESKKLFFRQLSEGISLSTEDSQNKGMIFNGTLHKDNSPSISLSRSNSQAAFKQGTLNNGDIWPNSTKSIDNEMKRHSIAVDESKYVREGFKSYKDHFDKEFANVSTSELVKRFAAMQTSIQKDSSLHPMKENTVSSGINISFIQHGDVMVNHDENSEDLMQQNGKKHKKVEFCKTEVHFAAESGRFNIVETDEKPPPSNMFRRRRRNSSANITTSPAVDMSKSNLPEVRFGDSLYEKKLLGGNENNSNDNTTQNCPSKIPPSVIPKLEMNRSVALATMTKFQDDADKEDQTYTQANATIVAALQNEMLSVNVYEEDSQNSSDSKLESSGQAEPLPRSILKNNRKPRPFLLGEKTDTVAEAGEKQAEDHEEKWGIRLRPVQNRSEHQTGPMWRSTITLQNTVFGSSKPKHIPDKEESELYHSSTSEADLRKLVRSLRPTSQKNLESEEATSGSSRSPKHSPISPKKISSESSLNGVQVKISTSSPEPHRHSIWSVADRIKQVEELKHSTAETKGYSTRINFGGGEATIIESVSSDDQQESSLKQRKPTHSPTQHIPFQQSDRPKQIWLRREEKKQGSVMMHGHPNLEARTDEPYQVSIATAVLPSYDQNRLRSVETLVSTRSGQPKITSISLRYDEDQNMKTAICDPLRDKDNKRYREENDRQGNQSITKTREKQRQGSQQNECTSLTYAPPFQTSIPEERISPPKDKIHSQPYFKDLYHKSEELLSHASTTSNYQLNKHVKRGRSCKDDSLLTNDPVVESELVLKDKKHFNSQNERLQLEINLNNNDRKIHMKESRSKSPARTSYSPSKNSLPQPGAYHNSTPEEKPSPVARSYHKGETTNTRPLTDNSQSSNSLCSSSNSSSLQNQIVHIRTETSGGKLLSSNDATDTRTAHKELRVDTDTNEVSVSKSQRTRSGCYQKDENSQKDKKISHSRSTSRGRSESPDKKCSVPSSVKVGNVKDQKEFEDSTDSPIYENRCMFSDDPVNKTIRKGRTDKTETDSTILEELTRAADQILQAVNGYTDDESNRASSGDDDEHRGQYKRGRRNVQVDRSTASLATISETNVHKQKVSSGCSKHSADTQKTGSTVKRTHRLSKSRIGQNSSTSSVESFTKEVRRSSASLLKKEQPSSVEDHAKRKISNPSTNPALKPGSRTARLLQRASSREMLLQTHASSSEDIMSGAEVENSRKPRAPRRNRISNTNTNKNTGLTSATSGTKKTSSLSASGQNISSPSATRLQKKDMNVTSRGRERNLASVTRQRKSSGDQIQSHSNRTRENRMALLDEEVHRRKSGSSRKESMEHKQRSGRVGMVKIAGSSFTQLTPSRDKLDVSSSERRSVGNNTTVVKSTTSHVVTKKKLSSSRNEGEVQNKSSM